VAGAKHGPSFNAVKLSNGIDPAWLRPPEELFTLGPGDRLEIELLGEPTSRALTSVAPDGKLYFNLLPGVDVWGLTLSQAKALLEQQLAQYVRQQPQVSLVLRGVESKRIWILGRVQAPGVYSIAAPMTLLEAISMAGGTLSLTSFRDQEAAGIGEEMADLRHSFVIRQGKLLPVDFKRLLIEGDLSQNIYLQPDDFVYFPSAAAQDVYVMGAVTQPQAVPYRKGLTVSAAVASAFGTLKDAYLSHVAVVRGSLTAPNLAIVDYKHVIRGEAPDMELQPQDIVYVPFSPYRYIEHYAEIIVNTFVSSAAINAGTRPLGQPQTVGGAGVFIPVGSGIQVIPPTAPPPIH
jgi:protein involved in polysaccharide export with SLBB domain